VTLQELVRLALAEDLGPGDLTSTATISASTVGLAHIRAKEPLVLSGSLAAAEVFRQRGVLWTSLVDDGEQVAPGAAVARISGPLRGLLEAERTALNFLMRLSGIATHTAKVVAGAGPLRVLDTRKSTPLLRVLEKAAVRHGGGANHRFGLFDGILIKENHILGAGGITAAVHRARESAHHLLRIQIEVENLAQLDEAIAAGADAVLLDNMNNEQLRTCVAMARGRVVTEASGNMNAERVAQLAESGLDQVSMGGLIHQAVWSDLSLRVDQAT
jgi:nicotinate-nucleotide pyrophosphorylase (carboxylating)